MQIPVSVYFLIKYISTTFAFPSTIYPTNLITINPTYLIPVRVSTVLPATLLNDPTTVATYPWTDIRMKFQAISTAIIYIPPAVFLNRHKIKRIIAYLIAIHSAHFVSILIVKIPPTIFLNTIISIIKQTDLLTIKEITIASVDIYISVLQTNMATIPKILIIILATDTFTCYHFFVGVLKPHFIIAIKHILCMHSHACKQYYTKYEYLFHRT